MQLEGCPEDFKYEEKNNKSYVENREWANSAVEKMTGRSRSVLMVFFAGVGIGKDKN